MNVSADRPGRVTHHVARVNDLAIHFVEAGDGPLVLLLHGFPYTWFAWRHQIAGLAAAGYRVVAPDLRGFGDTEGQLDATVYTILDSAADAIDLIEAIGGGPATIVGHDLGAWVACAASRLRPDLFTRLAMVGTAIPPREPVPPGEAWAAMEARFAGTFYHHYFQQPGLADAQFDADVARSLRGIYHAISGKAVGAERWRLFVLPGETALDTLPDPGRLPDWLPEADFAEYVRAYRKNGFTPPLNHYRCRDLSWERTAGWAGQPVSQSTLFVGGRQDPALPMMQAALDGLEATDPNLVGKFLLDGVGHGVPEEAPEALNQALLAFQSGS